MRASKQIAYYKLLLIISLNLLSQNIILGQANKKQNIDLTTWMSQLAPITGKRNLTEIFIPGSHDSATYKLEYNVGKGQDIPKAVDIVTGKNIVGPILKKWSQAQNLEILAQLNEGIRYLDLRVIYRDSKKQFYTVHGLYGPSLTDVLAQIDIFTKIHPKEIIIIEVGDLRYMPKGEQSHRDLIEIFKKTFGSKLIDKSMGLKTPIETLWANNKQILLMYNNTNIANQYDYVFPARIDIETKWPNKQSIKDLNAVLNGYTASRNIEQNSNGNLNSNINNNNKLYLLEAILTPTDTEIKKSFIPFSKNFKSLADMANAVKKELPYILSQAAKNPPEIILLDYVNKDTGKDIVNLNLNLAPKK